MIDLLEDHDGAPYPEEVQAFVRKYQPADEDEANDWRLELANALWIVAGWELP